MASVWLDLEETIIESWRNPVIINETKIRRYLRENNIKNINIFSFAIYDDHDREEFIENEIQDEIENILDVNIMLVPTVDEIQKSIYGYEKIKYTSRHEFIQLNGKHFGFIKYYMSDFVSSLHNILIDDRVPNLYININI